MLAKDFPLAWPSGQARTSPDARVAGAFRVSFQTAYDGCVREAERLHDREDVEVVVSANVPLGKTGLPVVSASGGPRIADPGVCVYLWLDGRPYAVACDTYREVRHNLRAVGVTIAALRTIARHGTGALLAQSMIGFCREIEDGVLDAPRIAAGGA